jgi:phosphinothricin acetyltransferase
MLADPGHPGAPAPATLRTAREDDAAALTMIYNHYIRDTIITFEEVPIGADEMGQRMADVASGGLPWLVATDDDRVIGYAYATPWRPRTAYRFAVESTIYLAPDLLGNGIGTMLYGALLDRLREGGIHAIIGGIALPNAASIRLHEKLGMHKVAHFEAVGFKFGQWIDVGYWQVTCDAPAGGR